MIDNQTVPHSRKNWESTCCWKECRSQCCSSSSAGGSAADSDAGAAAPGAGWYYTCSRHPTHESARGGRAWACCAGSPCWRWPTLCRTRCGARWDSPPALRRVPVARLPPALRQPVLRVGRDALPVRLDPLLQIPQATFATLGQPFEGAPAEAVAYLQEALALLPLDYCLRHYGAPLGDWLWCKRSIPFRSSEDAREDDTDAGDQEGRTSPTVDRLQTMRGRVSCQTTEGLPKRMQRMKTRRRCVAALRTAQAWRN
jgi:hypothetical protein